MSFRFIFVRSLEDGETNLYLVQKVLMIKSGCSNKTSCWGPRRIEAMRVRAVMKNRLLWKSGIWVDYCIPVWKMWSIQQPEVRKDGNVYWQYYCHGAIREHHGKKQGLGPNAGETKFNRQKGRQTESKKLQDRNRNGIQLQQQLCLHPPTTMN